MEKTIPVIFPYEERAKNTVIPTINHALGDAGRRLNLFELARTATRIWDKAFVNLREIKTPIVPTAAEFLTNIIENNWKLNKVFGYYLSYKRVVHNERTSDYYFKAVFSQPTPAYPIPQVTSSVYFTIVDKNSVKDETVDVTFRIEGQTTEHDIRYVVLTADWILALMQMKLKFFKRLESINLF